MKKIYLLILLLLIGSFIYAKGDGGSPGAFLNLDASVRSYTLGKIGFTEYNNPSSLTGNPALLSECRKSVYLMYSQLFKDFNGISHQTLFFNNKLDDNSGYGIGINLLVVSDVERRKALTGELEGTYSGKDIVYYLAYGRKLRKNISFGLNLKIINEKIAHYSRYNYTMDLGGKINFPGGAKWSLAVYNLLKLESDYIFISKKESIPIKLKSEFNLNIRKDVYFHLALSYQEKENSMKYYTGFEIDLFNYFVLRSGFNSISEEWTAGFGLDIFKFELDYGFGLQTDLGNTHRFGLTYEFGG